jgi:hypothetical protein
MKILKKLSINPEQVIKNEELVNLRGGYDGGYITGPPFYISCKAGAGTCGGFWRQNCDSDWLDDCKLIPACANATGFVCV